MCPTEGTHILLKMYSLVAYIIIFKLVFNLIISNYLAHPFKSCKMLRNILYIYLFRVFYTLNHQTSLITVTCSLLYFDCHMKVWRSSVRGEMLLTLYWQNYKPVIDNIWLSDFWKQSEPYLWNCLITFI